MRKIFMSLLAYCLLAAALPAQTLTWGRANIAKKTDYFPTRMLGEYEGKCYLTMQVGKHQMLQMYSKDKLLLEKEVKMLDKLGDKALRFESMFRFGDNFWGLYSHFDAKKRQTETYALRYNRQLEAVGELRLVATTMTRSAEKEGELIMKVSPDGAKITFFALHILKADEMQKVGVYMYDNQMQWQNFQEWTLPYANELFYIQDFSVDNEGNVYTLAKVYKNKFSEMHKGIINYTLNVFSLGDKGQKFDTNIDLGANMYLKDMKIIATNKNTMHIIGFYGNRATNEITKGFFSVVLDAKLDILKQSHKEFSPDIMEKFTNNSQTNKTQTNPKGLFSFRFKDIFTDKDSSLTIFAESSFIKSNTYTAPVLFYGSIFVGFIKFKTETNHDHDIMEIKIGADNEVKEIKSIAKKQISQSPIYHSFSSFYNKELETLYAVFHDNPKNTEVNAKKPLKMRVSEAGLAVVTLDKAGNMTKKFLQGRHPMLLLAVPRMAVQINEREMLIFAKNEKVYTLGIIDFSK